MPTPREGGYRLALAPTSLRTLLPTDVGHRQIAWMGFYELPLSRRIARLARERGGLLVDVGANAGYFSCLWTSLRTDNKCVAFEASPRNQAMLRENVAAAGLSGWIEIQACALGRADGVLPFDLGPPDQTGWGGFSQSEGPNTVSVAVRRLDEVLTGGQQISVLKIDVEGADAWVLEGTEKLLRERRVDHVFFERNEHRMQTLGIGSEIANDVLSACGYQVTPLTGDCRGTEFHATLRGAPEIA
jgi:FkbM family methyltransferase